MFFDPDVDPIVTNKTPAPGKDILTASANNLYVGVTMEDLEGFEEQLSAQLAAGEAATASWSKRSTASAAATTAQIARDRRPPRGRDSVRAPSRWRTALRALITFYQTGETADREAYDIAWVQDKASPVDTINGFVEVYMDARGMKGAWEALVFYVNREKTAEIQKLAADAQWFEDRMPWDAEYRKQGVRGITANAIDVVVETGDSGPITPVGINLPNDQDDPRAVRQQVGVAVERQRGLRQVDARRSSAASSRGRRRKRRAPRSGARSPAS